MPQTTKQCERCDTEFVTTKPAKRFCGEKCRAAAERARHWEKNREAINALRVKKRTADIDAFRAKERVSAARRTRRRPPSPVESNTRRNSRLERKYGMTLSEKQELSEKQGGRCLICQQVPPESYGLVVDHCHATRALRGLLCHRCNTGLGLFKDDPERLIVAAEYLRRDTAKVQP